ncbi:MAG: ABC transporter ATP-binding protein [Candidatus Thorarchaeota archaeon]|nr:MAG: ABC transporter ATP-binding protein [Candidatus Thorarchaeota archaeon]
MGMRGHGGPRALAARGEKRSRPVRVLLGRMAYYLGRFKRIVILGAALSLVSTILGVLVPIVLTNGIDTVAGPSANISNLLLLVGMFVSLSLASWILGSSNTWILAGAQAGFVQTVQSDVYDHLVSADLLYHKSEQSGNVTSRVTTDTVSLATGIQVIITFSSQVVLLITTFSVLWLTSPAIAITALIVVPGVALIAGIFGTVGQRIMLASQRAYGAVSGQIAENLSGIHVAKAFNREDELAEEMSELNQKAYNHGFRFMILMSAMQPLVRSFGQIGVAAILFVGGTLAVGTAAVLSIGEVVLGVILVNSFMMPLMHLSMMASQVQASLAAMDRISDVLESKPSIADALESVPLRPESDGIKFEDVTFSYVEGTEVLRDATFEIKPGEMVAVVGHTGAGKTTLAALVNRFYDPQEGAILIGDQDLRSVTLESLHEAVSLIPQEPYLFDGTILENIRYGRPEATDKEIQDLCEIIGASDFIEVLSEGYETLIIEDGKNLSAGQRQMITIARTMLANPRILILDEATSRLDAYSESLVQDAQAMLFANRTTIVIAHRLTTIANASRVLVFAQGELIEQGTHEELLALGGTFKTLYDTYYAHQGVEEITEDAARVAEVEIAKHGRPEVTAPSGSMAMSMMGPHSSMSSMGGGHGGGPPGEVTPEMIEHLKENLDRLPPEMQKRVKAMLASQQDSEQSED